MAYQKVIIAGNLGKDPQMQYNETGKPRTWFSVATETGWGERKETLWVDVTVFGGQAETCSQYLQKGSKVLVEGKLSQPGAWVHKTSGDPQASIRMTADRVVFLSKIDNEQSPHEYDEGDDIPF